ncbi:MAG: toll/interleukin-1 receptor domain-containing protein [Methylobacter sp.]
MTPKVFVSHASEDKDRFVLQFAAHLRQNGIDAWLDKWEMLPGDSLVDKIFEEGIKEAKAVIIVLSKFSVDKPWVREELNAACVKRINNGSKLIPVVIDDCEIPEVLKSTLWEKITDLSSYDANLERIISSIFGVIDKPPIGSSPEYLKSFISNIGGLNNIDSLVLRLSCEAALESGNDFLDPENVFLKDGKPLVPEQDLEDSLEMLDRNGYIKLSRTIGGGLFHYQIAIYGFDVYANSCIPNYQDRVVALVSAIVNQKLENNIALQQELNEPQILINHILDALESKNHLTQIKTLGGHYYIHNISPALKRSLSGG